MANVLAPRMADGASAVTDSLGRFHITGIEWADGTYFVIGALNKKDISKKTSIPISIVIPKSRLYLRSS